VFLKERGIIELSVCVHENPHQGASYIRSIPYTLNTNSNTDSTISSTELPVDISMMVPSPSNISDITNTTPDTLNTIDNTPITGTGSVTGTGASVTGHMHLLDLFASPLQLSDKHIH